MAVQQTLIALQPEPAEVRLARALEELDRARKAVEEIQHSLLPASLPEIPGFELSPYYRPSQHASGDYYDVVPLIDNHWGFVMADVAGHGIPAAVIMTVMRTLIHAELPSNRDKSAGEFLEHVNGVMCETYLRNGRFVTVWAAVLDPVSRRLTYVSAGHNPPRLLRGGSVLALDVVGGLPLGIDSAATYEDEGFTLELQDLLVIYTDGITEARRPGIDRLELFGTEGRSGVKRVRLRPNKGLRGACDEGDCGIHKQCASEGRSDHVNSPSKIQDPPITEPYPLALGGRAQWDQVTVEESPFHSQRPGSTAFWRIVGKPSLVR